MYIFCANFLCKRKENEKEMGNVVGKLSKLSGWSLTTSARVRSNASTRELICGLQVRQVYFLRVRRFCFFTQ